MHSGKPMDPDVLPEETRKVVISPRVRQDLIDILRFTVETSGKRQLHTYRDRINDALQAIGRNPAIGQHSQALPEHTGSTSLVPTSSCTAIRRHPSLLSASCINE
jgi:plasmid stabilization system protein ParE